MKALLSKSSVGATLSRVRISPPPPFDSLRSLMAMAMTSQRDECPERVNESKDSKFTMNQPTAQNAINILEQLQDQIGSVLLAYWVTPNTVLTLSDARAYCDGVFYGKNRAELEAWTKEIANSIEVLKSITNVYFSEATIDSNGEEDLASYEVITSQGLHYSFERTALLGASEHKILLQNKAPKTLKTAMCKLLKANKKLSHFSDENIKHIAFGILVGYPDQAILGSAEEWEFEDNLPKDKKDSYKDSLVFAKIQDAGFYDCPQPIYSYPRKLATDPTIKAHERLWSTILQDFYSSDFHQTLAKNPDFHQKAKELGIIR